MTNPVQTGLICFDIVARIHQSPVDLRAISREYAVKSGEIPSLELLRIIRHCQFKAKLKNLDISAFEAKYPLPSIAIQKDGHYIVLLKLKETDKKALIFSPIENQTIEFSYEDLNYLLSGQFIVLSKSALNQQIQFSFGWFYQEIFRYKQVIAEVMLGSFMVQLFGLVIPLFTQVILDKVIVHRSLTTLDVLTVAFLAVMIFEVLLNITRNFIFIHTANKIDAKLGAKLFKHLFSLPYVYFESRKVGNIVAKVRELDNIREFITEKSVSVILDMFFSVIFLLMMFFYSVKLTLVVLAFITLIALIYVVITPELRRRLETKFQMGAQANSYLVESITGIQTIKSLSIEGSMQRKWEDQLASYLKSSFKLSVMGKTASAISTLLQKALTITILYLGVKLVIDNQLTLGQLIAFQMFTNQLTSPLLRLVNLWNDLQQTLLAVDRLGDILNHPIEIQSSQAITLPNVRGVIRFDKLSFRYTHSGPAVIDNIDLTINEGQSIGIVGRSGSGKSTLTKLIQRLYLPQSGAIYIDDIDLRHINPMWLRNHIGVVLQENYLFSGTIRDNIALPKQDASIDQIINASMLAGAHDFIAQLPEGYETIVGERGSTLSGGQKQRIAIARALITNPKILIFDEATSALDYESEKIIQKNLTAIRRGRTVVMIAHRLATVQDCDFIIAMDKGKIIEMGTHHILIQQQGYYHFLYSQQGNK